MYLLQHLRIAVGTLVFSMNGLNQGERLPLLSNPGVLHKISFAKYAVALFWLLFSRLCRCFSLPSRESFN